MLKENRDEIKIQATPEKIWEVLTDQDKYAEWNSLLYNAEGKVAVGEKVNLSARTTSNDMIFLCSVKKFEANHQFS